jgi:O-antigen/teichoic acid export membrane protein
LAEHDAFELRDGLSTVTRGTLFVIVSTLCLVVFNFLSRVLVVRSISPSEWSAFSLGLALAGILSSVGTLGLPSAVARSLPYSNSDAERRTVVRSAISATFVAAIALSALLWVLASHLAQLLGSPQLTLGLEYFSIAIGSSIGATLIASIFQGYSDVTPNALFVQILNPGLFLAFLVIAILLPAEAVTYSGALLAYALANVFTLAALVVYLARRLPRHLPPGPLAPEAQGRLFRFAAPLFVAGAMFSLAGFGDTLVLGFYHHAEVGTYTASLTLARLLQIGINAASYIFLPVAARFLRRQNFPAIRVTYGTVTKWMALLSLPLFLLFFLLPQRSLGFVYGPTYDRVVIPLQFAVGGAFVATLLGPGATTQVAYGRVRMLAYNSIAAGAADVTIAFALVPTYGYVGAAVAWGAANVLYAGLCLLELATLDGIHPFRRHFVLPLAISAIPLTLVLLPFRTRIPEWALPPVGLAIAGAFVLAVIVTGSLDDGDRLLLGAVEGLIGRPLPFVHRLSRWYRRRDGPP